MKSFWILLLVSIFPSLGFAGDECHPNLIGVDMCAQARELQMHMADNLPQKMNSEMTLTKILATGPQLNLYAQFSYNRSYIENLAAGKISMGDLAEKLKGHTQTVICKQEVTAAFVRLGGKISYSYSFSDDNPYMEVLVDHCEPQSNP